MYAWNRFGLYLLNDIYLLFMFSRVVLNTMRLILPEIETKCVHNLLIYI